MVNAGNQEQPEEIFGFLATAQPVDGELLILGAFLGFRDLLRCSVMRDLAVLFIHLITTIARLGGPGCARSVIAESVLVGSNS